MQNEMWYIPESRNQPGLNFPATWMEQSSIEDRNFPEKDNFVSKDNFHAQPLFIEASP